MWKYKKSLSKASDAECKIHQQLEKGTETKSGNYTSSLNMTQVTKKTSICGFQ